MVGHLDRGIPKLSQWERIRGYLGQASLWDNWATNKTQRTQGHNKKGIRNGQDVQSQTRTGTKSRKSEWNGSQNSDWSREQVTQGGSCRPHDCPEGCEGSGTQVRRWLADEIVNFGQSNRTKDRSDWTVYANDREMDLQFAKKERGVSQEISCNKCTANLGGGKSTGPCFQRSFGAVVKNISGRRSETHRGKGGGWIAQIELVEISDLVGEVRTT